MKSSDHTFPNQEELISRRIVLHHALKTLTATQYERFLLYAKGYSVSEIARMKHLTRQAVHESIQVARRKLARFMNNL